MGFFDFLKKPGQFPQVELYKHDVKTPENKYESRVEKVLCEGAPNCHHEWREIFVSGVGTDTWIRKGYGRPSGFEGAFEEVRKPYLCHKCEAECVMLFLRRW